MKKKEFHYTYKMKIAYDGTPFSGWQVQKNARSIQELIEKAVRIAVKEEVSVIGSGRTDAGVHAMAQVAHFNTLNPIKSENVCFSLNGMLPKEIRILSLEETYLGFHAQLSAKSKTYHYHVSLKKTLLPFKRFYSHHIPQTFDLNAVRQAIPFFLGTHDYTSFANEAHSGSAAKDPVRTLSRLDLIENDGELRLEFEADGFLYKMVRNIAGTLFEIGVGKKTAQQVPEILAAKDRRKAGQAAPAQGLFLVDVHY